MSTNLATILVGLGYDLSALEKGAPEAFRLINSQTASMSAEMKRTSREGAESLRLIDEALGIHLSRPLTRILTQEFPGLAKGLQSILGAGVVGALGLAAFEFFDRIAKGIEKAQKAQEEFAAAQEKLANVQKSIGDQWQEKINRISFTPGQKIFAEGAAEALKQIKELGAAIDEVEKKEQAALHPAFFSFQPGPETLAGIKTIEEFFSSEASKRIENNAQHFENLRKSIEDAFQADKILGTDNAIKSVDERIASLNALLAETQTHEKPINIPGVGELQVPQRTLSPEGLKTAQAELGYLVEIKNEVESQRKSWEALTAAQEAQAAALKRAADAAKAFGDLQHSIGETLAKLQPQTDPIAKLSEEIHLMRYKAEQDFAELGRNSDSALQMRAAMAALDQYEHRLDHILAMAKNAADITKAQADLPSKIVATTAAPQFGAGAGPVLGPGGSAAEQYDAFLKDQNAQLKLAAQAYQDLVTPQQKFQLAEQELGVLLDKQLIDWKAYTGAIQKAREEMAKATDQMDKMLKEGGAAGGIQAFFQQLKGQGGKGSDGQFTFDLLNKGLQGFEDETVKALTGAKTSWRSFFESLDQMALKFVMNKLFSQLLSATGIGNLLNGLFSGLGGGGGGPIGGGSWGNVSGVLSDAGISGFAEGTDFAPGGLSWVGENGPELMNVPAGASITPMSSMARGVNLGGIHIDAKGAELGVEEKIARAMAASAPHLILRAVAEMNEVQRRTPR